MLKLLLLFPLLVLAFMSDAQERKIAGLVIYNSERQTGAIVKNINTRTQTISNDKGEFAIVAKSDDTLIISKEDYVKDTLVVAGQQEVIIQLHKNPSMLREVVVNSTYLTPVSVYEANKKVYKEIYFLGDNSGIFFSGSLVNIDKLNNSLGKKGRDARWLQHTLTKDYENNIVDKRFNPLASRITGYKGQQLLNFIQDNRPSYEMVIISSDYDIIQYIKRRLSQNKKK